MASTNIPDNDPKEVPEPAPVTEPKPHDNVSSPPPKPVRMQQSNAPSAKKLDDTDLDYIDTPDSFDSFHQMDTSTLTNSDYAAGGHEVENAKKDHADHPHHAHEAPPSTREVAQPRTPFATNEVGSQYGSGELGAQYESGTPAKPESTRNAKSTVHKPINMARNDSHHGENYENWRLNQIAKLDRKYEDLRRDPMHA